MILDSAERRIAVRDNVRCPVCHAAIGTPCRNEPTEGQHSQRVAAWERCVAPAVREHQLLRLQDRINEMEQERIAGVSHAMLDRAFVRDDRDLLLQIRDRLRAVQTEGDLMYSPWSPTRALASQILALYPDDLL